MDIHHIHHIDRDAGHTKAKPQTHSYRADPIHLASLGPLQCQKPKPSHIISGVNLHHTQILLSASQSLEILFLQDNTGVHGVPFRSDGLKYQHGASQQ